MDVLITGGTSLLGRSVAALLGERGDHVTCFQRRPSGAGIRDVLGDIRDRTALVEAARGHDAVIHLAALVAPNPPLALAEAVNVQGTANAMAAASLTRCFVHISSPSVAFSSHAVMGLAIEPAAYRGRDPYTVTKARAEQLVLAQHDVATVVIRPHLVWGPGDTQLVGRIVERARSGRLVLPDGGRALIDTTYVDDAAAAIVAALDKASAHDPAVLSRAFVVTGGDPRPLAELVRGICEAAGLEVAPRSVPAPMLSIAGRLCDLMWRRGEPPITYFAARQLSLAHWFDIAATKAALGWEPTVSVTEGMRRLRAQWR